MFRGTKTWLGALAGAAAMMLLVATAGAQQSPGLLGQYYSYDPTIPSPPDRTLVFVPANLTGSRIDPVVNFGNPFTLPGSTPHKFALRETGYIIVPTTGTYHVTSASDDGNRLWISTAPINADNPPSPGATVWMIDGWVDRGETEDPPVTIQMTAGTKYYLQYEMEENGGGNAARLRFDGPGFLHQIIPASVLFHDTPTDTSVPGAITDLKATSPTATSITLTFTAPGKTGATGTPLDYDIRESTTPLTAANWTSAAEFTPFPPVVAGGTAVSFVASGLQPIEHYYFAIAANDANGSSAAPAFADATTTPTPLTSGATAQFFAYDPTLPGSPDRTLVFDPAGQNGAPGLVYTTLVPNIDVIWPDTPGLGGAAPGVPNNKFAVRYTGFISSPTTGDINFYTASDDGVRFWISPDPTKTPDPNTATADSDHWVDRGVAEDAAVTIHMVAGMKYPFVLEYYENGGGNEIHLRWDSADGMTHIPVPASAFSPNPAITIPANGRFIGQVVDSTGKAVPSAIATFTVAGGKPVVVQADASGNLNTLLPPGAQAITVALPAPLSSVTQTGLTATIASDQVLTQNLTVTTSIPQQVGSLSLRTADLPAGESWSFLAPPDVSVFQTTNAAGATVQDYANQAKIWGNPALPITGTDKTTGAAWVTGFPVPADAAAADAATTMIDPMFQIPSNAYWVQAISFKTPAGFPSGAGITYALQDFNVDDNLYGTFLNGTKIQSFDQLSAADTIDPTQSSWVLDWAINIPAGLLKTDGTPNLLTMVGYQGGGGAGITNTALAGPRIVAYSTTGGGTKLILGDPGNHGSITIADATLVLQFVVKLKTPTTDQTTASDVDKDGAITIKDVTKILQAIVNHTGF